MVLNLLVNPIQLIGGQGWGQREGRWEGWGGGSEVKALNFNIYDHF